MDAEERATKRYKKILSNTIEREKDGFAKEVKRGLGNQMVDELNNLKPPTKRGKFISKIRRILGL